jgi:hypothetical protein
MGSQLIELHSVPYQLGPNCRNWRGSVQEVRPTETFNYLVLLATLGKLGRTENEVATHILVREAYAMLQNGFHDERIPAAPADQE